MNRLAPLGELVDFISGFAFKSGGFNTEGLGLPLVRIRDVVPGTSSTYYAGEYDTRYLVSDGDYLVGMDGEFNLGRWRGGAALLNQRVCKLGELDPALDRAYLAHMLPGELKRIEDATPFATVKHLSVKTLRGIIIPLPPLDEQRRIATILDHVDALRAKRRQVLTHLDALAQALYEHLIGSNDWPYVKIKTITSKVGSGATPRGGQSAYKTEGVALIRSMNVHDGKFRWKDLAFLDDQQAAALSNVVVEADDVLLNITGASVARVNRAPASVLPARVNQHVAIIRPTPGTVHPRILERHLISPRTKRALLNVAGGGATREAITKAQILDLEVPIPDRSAQERYLSAAARLDDLQGRSRAALEAADSLVMSLQSRAFRGEL